MKKIALSLGIALALVSGLNAQIFTGTFNLAGSGNDVTSFAYNGPTINNATVGNLQKVGITTSSSTGNFRGTNWSTAAIDTGKYITFTLTAASGYELDLTSLTFGIGRSGTGPVNWEWRSSVDNFASTISTYSSINAGLTNNGGVLTNPDSNSSWTGNVIDLSGASYQGLSAITFRFYGYTAEAGSGTGGLQGNLSFAGETVAVPEPSTYAMLIAGAGVMFWTLRRKRA